MSFHCPNSNKYRSIYMPYIKVFTIWYTYVQQKRIRLILYASNAHIESLYIFLEDVQEKVNNEYLILKPTPYAFPG